MQTENLDKIDIIRDIKIESVKEILNDTIEKKWQKNCPKCGCIQSYIHKRSLNDSIRYGWVCNICKDIIRKEKTFQKYLNAVFKKTCSKCGCIQTYKRQDSLDVALKNDSLCKNCCLKGRSISEQQKQLLKQRTGPNNPRYGKKVSQSTKIKMSLSHKGKPGKPHSEQTKHKLRLIRSKWVNENAGGPQFNPTACKYFDELNKRNGWNLQHALNGGEFYIKTLGYFVDAYDKKLNIVVEYDEPKHYTVEGNLKHKDVIRQDRIIKSLNCKFFRYNELTKQFTTPVEQVAPCPTYNATPFI